MTLISPSKEICLQIQSESEVLGVRPSLCGFQVDTVQPSICEHMLFLGPCEYMIARLCFCVRVSVLQGLAFGDFVLVRDARS